VQFALLFFGRKIGVKGAGHQKENAGKTAQFVPAYI
jgi:hypothetical protein